MRYLFTEIDKEETCGVSTRLLSELNFAKIRMVAKKGL